MSEQLLEPVLINTGDVDNPVPVSQAILDGYAPDDELYTYENFPEISYEELSRLSEADYPTIFYEVTRKLLGSAIPDEELKSIAKDAYSPENFDFDNDGSLRFTKTPSGAYIFGLSDGPTAAFKDMAMQPLARILDRLHEKLGIPLTIMLSTSGDTGRAALEAFANLSNAEIICMFPSKGVSSIQRAQMVAASENENTHVLEVEGDFSYINDLHMMANEAYDLGSVNSVNIGRLISQIPYYVASYLKAIELEGKQIGDPIDVSIPSGNFGNALSAIIAREMGVPIRDIIVATNENNILDTMFSTGVFQKSEFVHTDSSAQDIRMPSNVWRYFAMLYGNDTEKIAKVYKTYKEKGGVDIGSIGIENESVIRNIKSATVTREERSIVIKDNYAASGGQLMIDPHTANGLTAIEKLGGKDPEVPMLVPETAKSYIFREAMRRLGINPPLPERFIGLEEAQRGKKLVRITDFNDLSAYLKDNTGAKPNNHS